MPPNYYDTAVESSKMWESPSLFIFAEIRNSTAETICWQNKALLGKELSRNGAVYE